MMKECNTNIFPSWIIDHNEDITQKYIIDLVVDKKKSREFELFFLLTKTNQLTSNIYQ